MMGCMNVRLRKHAPRWIFPATVVLALVLGVQLFAYSQETGLALIGGLVLSVGVVAFIIWQARRVKS
jgi:hypothetical protein